MKQEIIHSALNGLDADMVEKVGGLRTRKKHTASLFIRFGAAAACVSLAVLAFLAIRRNAPSGGNTEDTVLGTRVYTNDKVLFPDSVDISSPSYKKWEDKTVSEKYHTLLFGEEQYSSKNVSVPEEKLGEYIGEYTLRGFDMEAEDDDMLRTITGRAFEINGVLKDCAVAVRFDGDDGNYVYINSGYRAATLGEFLDAMSLDENMTFGPVDYYYEPDINALSAIEYDGVDVNVIRSLIFDSREIREAGLNENTLPSSIRISLDIPLLGFEDSSFWLTDDGYLITNILNSGKAFFIGEEQAKQFKDYVIKNHKGYELVYPKGEQTEIDGMDEIEAID